MKSTVFALGLLFFAAPSIGQELFSTRAGVPAGVGDAVQDDPLVVRNRTAAMDGDRLFRSTGRGTRFVLNLFADAEFPATVDGFRTAPSGAAFVYATLDDGGHATFFVSQGIVKGEVHSPHGVYTIRSTGTGAQSDRQVSIAELDVSGQPAIDDGPLIAEVDVLRGRWPAPRGVGVFDRAIRQNAEEVDGPGPDETVDLFVVYTPGVENREGGRPGVEATIIAEVEKTNQAMVNSGLDNRQFRLVATQRIEHPAVGDFHAILRVAQARKGDDNDSEGLLDDVLVHREKHGADLVHFLVTKPAGPCGSAFSIGLNVRRAVESYCSQADEGCSTRELKGHFGRWGYGVTRAASNCITGYTFSHEVGHNFGLLHDRYWMIKRQRPLSLANPPNFSYAPYGFGYVNQNFSRSKCFATILARTDQCYDDGPGTAIRAPMFANPDLELGSEEVGFDPAGIPGDEWTVDLKGPANASRAIDDVWDILANAYSLTEIGHAVPFMPSASDSGRQGFVRVINHGDEAGEVSVEAFDDAGTPHGPVTLSIDANETAHFNSDDLEAGNTDKGLSDGVGQPDEGDWRLKLTSLLDIEVLAYVRTEDGFLTAMHDLMPAHGPGRRGVIFNPASNENQVSWLRLVNPRDEATTVTITGLDDDGVAGEEVRATIPAGAAWSFSAEELETGNERLDGALGDGKGKWRLFVEAEKVYAPSSGLPLPWILAMSLLESPTGHLTNLSSLPSNKSRNNHSIPLFPAKSAEGRQGFARVINRSENAGEAMIVAFDDMGTEYGPITLALEAGAVAHFNSDDLEDGNTDKGLSGGVGDGEGDWRLKLTSNRKIDVLGYVRTEDGFVTTMHDVAPSLIHTHRAAVFNPGRNTGQVSSLRLVNPGEDDAEVTIKGIDGMGQLPPNEIRVAVPARAARTFTAQELEAGGEQFEGALGPGAGKWQLTLEADRRIVAMSLLESPTGHLTNLSTAPVRGPGPWPPPAVSAD